MSGLKYNRYQIDEADLVRRYAAGDGSKKIAKDLGVKSHRQILLRLAALGIDRRAAHRPRTRDEKEVQVASMLKSGFTVGEIAEALGCTPCYAYDLRRGASSKGLIDVKPRKRSGREPKE